jgi:hypothetical protein
MFDNFHLYSLNGIQQVYSARIARRLGMLIGLLLLSVISYFIIWRAFMKSISFQVLQVHKSLAIVPLDLIIKIKALNNYIHKERAK